MGLGLDNFSQSTANLCGEPNFTQQGVRGRNPYFNEFKEIP